MSLIVIIDTTVFLNALDVPGFNQHRESVLTELETLIGQLSANLLLPLATIIETGNHIAHLADGRLRRGSALNFARQVKLAIIGSAPWSPTRPITGADLNEWLDRFPDMAMQGVGLADLGIVSEWELACELHPLRRVRIWSLDDHLKGYDRAVKGQP
jgi:hypothetical protein